MRVLVTGTAGFIGYHVAQALQSRGDEVVGLDNLNAYYDLRLKHARLAALRRRRGFRFVEAECSDQAAYAAVAGDGAFDAVVHLAAQAGVRYSLENPLAYVDANVRGQVVVLEEAARRGVPVVYASSSSVYGANRKAPFSESDRVDSPVSLYAATKRAGELIATAYRSTHGLRATGLRFFTVYGPFGRPDMAPWLFTDAILAGRPITLFNKGRMERDFTDIRDITRGVLSAIDRIADSNLDIADVYNLGRGAPVRLKDFVAAIERATGREAVKTYAPKPPGDVVRTHASTERAARDLHYAPEVDLVDGIADFVQWFRTWKDTA